MCGPDIDQKLVRLARANGHTRVSGESSEWGNNRGNDIGWSLFLGEANWLSTHSDFTTKMYGQKLFPKTVFISRIAGGWRWRPQRCNPVNCPLSAPPGLSSTISLNAESWVEGLAFLFQVDKLL